MGESFRDVKISRRLFIKRSVTAASGVAIVLATDAKAQGGRDPLVDPDPGTRYGYQEE